MSSTVRVVYILVVLNMKLNRESFLELYNINNLQKPYKNLFTKMRKSIIWTQNVNNF